MTKMFLRLAPEPLYAAVPSVGLIWWLCCRQMWLVWVSQHIWVFVAVLLLLHTSVVRLLFIPVQTEPNAQLTTLPFQE